MPATPTVTPRAAKPYNFTPIATTPSPAASAEPIAGAQERDANGSPNSLLVPREMYEDASKRGDEYKELLDAEQKGRAEDRTMFKDINDGLIQDTKSAFDRVADIADLLAKSQDRLPAEIVQGIADVVTRQKSVPKPEVLADVEDTPDVVDPKPYEPQSPRFQTRSTFRQTGN